MRLSPVDLGFWDLDSPTSRQVIAAFCPLASSPDREILNGSFGRLLEVFPRFRDRVSFMGSPYWSSDPEFNLSHHLHFEQCAGSLVESAAGRFSQPLPEGRPPWEFIVWESPGPSGFLFRFHHSLADGLGGLSAVEVLCGGEVRGRPARPSSGIDSVKPLSFLLNQLLPTNPSPMRGTNSSARAIETFSFPLDRLNPLRRSMGVTLNDIFLTLAARALRQFSLSRRYPLVGTRAIVPVSRRAVGGGLGNALTAVDLPLPLDCADPLQHLTLIRQVAERLRRGSPSYESLAPLAQFLPSPVRRALIRFAFRRSTFICTNIPGPKRERFLAGARIEQFFGFPALLRGHGASFSLMSYAGTAGVAIVTDPAIVPDPAPLVRGCLDAIEELEGALQLPKQPNVDPE